MMFFRAWRAIALGSAIPAAMRVERNYNKSSTLTIPVDPQRMHLMPALLEAQETDVRRAAGSVPRQGGARRGAWR